MVRGLRRVELDRVLERPHRFHVLPTLGEPQTPDVVLLGQVVHVLLRILARPLDPLGRLVVVLLAALGVDQRVVRLGDLAEVVLDLAEHVAERTGPEAVGMIAASQEVVRIADLGGRAVGLDAEHGVVVGAERAPDARLGLVPADDVGPRAPSRLRSVGRLERPDQQQSVHGAQRCGFVFRIRSDDLAEPAGLLTPGEDLLRGFGHDDPAEPGVDVRRRADAHAGRPDADPQHVDRAHGP